jgi:putative PIN family toxin of toxin-antitoxin system
VIRAVLDTNQLVSVAIRPGGIADQIRRAWQERRFILLTSPPLLAEFRRVLTYPKLRSLVRLSPDEEEALLRLLVEEAEITAGTLQVQVIEADPADDAVLACAIEGHADYIVSGDAHLLSLHEHAGMPIITAREFLGILEKKPYPEGG